MTVNELKSLIEYHDDLYYNQGITEITDAEYDALRQQLLDLDKDALDYVPGETTGLFPKYEHTHPIASLAKVNTEEDLRKEVEKLLPVVIEPKFDGLTIVSYPTGAKVTRGNGEVGDDLSVNFSSISVEEFYMPVRGEAIISKENFERLNKERIESGEEPFKNARNAVAGMLRNKDASRIKYVDFIAYDIVGANAEHSKCLENHLKANDFRITDYWRFETVDEVVEFVKNFNKDDYPYELDGLVIKSDLFDSEAIFGRTGHHPKNAVAYKFEAQGEWTTLEYVHWTVGRTGKTVPNAVFEPIELLGATVSNSTLHNKAYIESLKLSEGCKVFVVKANDIIPAIVKTDKYNPLQKIRIPTDCPKCQEPLEEVNDQLYCRNDLCESRVVANTVHLASKHALDIVGLSESTIEKLYKEGIIAEPREVLYVKKRDLLELEGFAEKSAEKIYQAIQKARTTTLDRFVCAAGIPLIGRTASKEMAKIYKDFNALVLDYQNGFPLLSEVEGIGETMISSLYNNFNLLLDFENALIAVSNPLYKEAEEINNNTEVYTIAVTGKFDKPRDYYQGLIEGAYHEFSTSVTKKTTHLLAGDKAGSKLEKAQKAGITILTSEEELLQLINS